MKVYLWLFAFCLVLFNCGSDNEESSADNDWEDEEELAFDAEEEAGEFGTITIELPEDDGKSDAACSMNLNRSPEDRLANAIITFDIFGEGCDGMGHCDNPDMQSGDIMYSGGIDGDNPFATMVLNYQPPGDSEARALWMYNAIYKAEPFSRFEMLVDGQSFNVLTSDLKGADDLTRAPFMWNTRIEIEADVLQSTEADDPSAPGLQARGAIVYEGPCEVFARRL